VFNITDSGILEDIKMLNLNWGKGFSFRRLILALGVGSEKNDFS
jgi:hypothetical protein